MTHTPRPEPMFGLWALTGMACVVSVLGIFSVGLFVAPFALALLVLSVVLTVRRPQTWPCLAGLGLALSLGIAWLGVVLGGAEPSSGSCSATADAVVTCVSEGRTVPGTFATAVAAPWFTAAAVVLVLTVVAYVAARTRMRAAGVGT